MSGPSDAAWGDPLPTLAALRAARAARGAALRRWLRWACLIGGVLLGSSLTRSHLRVGGSPRNTAVALAFVCFIALLGIAARLASGGPPWLDVRPPMTRTRLVGLTLTLLPLVAVSVALEWLHSGAGTIGLYAAVSISTRIYPRRIAAAVFGVCLGYFLVITVLAEAVWTNPRTGQPGLADVVAVTTIYLLSLFINRFRAQERLEERLLGELEESRAAELHAAALAERQRLAREMHDVLAHSLSGLVLQLEGARMLAATAPDDRRLPELIDGAHQLAKNGLAEARQAIGMLRDQDLPGPDRLAGLANAFTADTGVPCQFSKGGDSRELDPAVRLALYRVAQEALTNVRKHARPDLVTVRLEYLADAVTLTISDAALEPAGDARADTAPPPTTPAAKASGGYGLAGMRERAELLGGTVTAAPTRSGFRIRLEVPA